MADEVHVHQTPPPRSNGGGGSAGWIVAILAIIVIALVAWLFFVRGADSGSGVPDEVDVEVNVPAPSDGN
jgi:hypothetical protein